MNEFDRSRRQSPEFAVWLCIAAYCIVIYQCRQDDVSTCTYRSTRIHWRIHACSPARGKPKRPFSHWPFSELTTIIDRREFWHKMSKFISSERQSRICFRPDTRGFLLLYGRLPPMQCCDTLHNKNAVMQLYAYIREVCKDTCIYSIGFCKIYGKLWKRIFYWMQRRILCGNLFNHYLFS